MVFSLAACGGAGNKDDSAAPKTDMEYVKANGKLIVIDGGKGQLSSVNQVFEEFKIKDIDLISLAEREEDYDHSAGNIFIMTIQLHLHSDLQTHTIGFVQNICFAL